MSIAHTIDVTRPPLVGDGRGRALLISALLHLLLLAAVIGWHAEPLPMKPTATVAARLIQLPAPAPASPPAVEPDVEPVLSQPTPAPEPKPTVKPPPPPVPSSAELARRRLEEREAVLKQELQQERQQAREREREEQKRIAAERQQQLEAQRALARQAEAEAQARQRATAQAAADRAIGNSSRYEPIEKIAPAYPPRAMERRLEGDCTVRYTVTAAGRVRDPAIAGDCHPFFVTASLAAASRFRYQPRLVDGRPVDVPGVTNTFHYRIDSQP